MMLWGRMGAGLLITDACTGVSDTDAVLAIRFGVFGATTADVVVEVGCLGAGGVDKVTAAGGVDDIVAGVVG